MSPRVLLRLLAIAGITSLAVAAVPHASAAQISGAIFTTLGDGQEVNYNQFPSKDAVYLDGGPGPGAPSTAAGLPPGIYVFQVTDPSGKTLLSTDAAQCREFTVGTGGYLTDVTPSLASCAHATAPDLNQVGGVTVQLIPYLDTPNNGGVYKVWATPVGNYVCALTVVDCGYTAGRNVHGFVPSNSKTDNFKVKQVPIREIDTRFHDTNNNGALIDGLGITHTDPLGASDPKWSYYNQALDVNHEAHVEAVEDGTHLITINNQAGCTVDGVAVGGVSTGLIGPQTVSVKISPNNKAMTVFVDVDCN